MIAEPFRSLALQQAYDDNTDTTAIEIAIDQRVMVLALNRPHKKMHSLQSCIRS